MCQCRVHAVLHVTKGAFQTIFKLKFASPLITKFKSFGVHASSFPQTSPAVAVGAAFPSLGTKRDSACLAASFQFTPRALHRPVSLSPIASPH
jgi:hypothetical protein